MINVKVVPAYEKKYPVVLSCCTYYSCKRKDSQKHQELLQERHVFVIVPSDRDYGKKMVLWLNSTLGFDYYSTLQDDYCDFQEVKDAELTFYV